MESADASHELSLSERVVLGAEDDMVSMPLGVTDVSARSLDAEGPSTSQEVQLNKAFMEEHESTEAELISIHVQSNAETRPRYFLRKEVCKQHC